MPRYDYRCHECGAEFEVTHGMRDTLERSAHTQPDSDAACDGPIERLISAVGVNKKFGDKAPSDDKLNKAGFTKYVRGAKGYEKAFGGGEHPDFINRE